MIIVVDTNEIISSLIRDSVSRRILLNPRFLFLTPDFTLEELRKHVPLISRKSSLSESDVSSLVDVLFERIEVIGFSQYRRKYAEASRILGGVDPDDVPFLALALCVDCDGIWSNDKHFHKQDKIKVWTTDDLLKII